MFNKKPKQVYRKLFWPIRLCRMRVRRWVKRWPIFKCCGRVSD